jgi:hypothetical protein
MSSTMSLRRRPVTAMERIISMEDFREVLDQSGKFSNF